MVTILLALGVIILHFFLLLIVVYFFTDRKKLSLLTPWITNIVRVIYTSAVLGSLYFSEILGYAPCLLCWWQRIFIFGITVLLWTSNLRKSALLQKQVIVFGIIGSGVALFHTIIDFFALGIDTCGATGISCLKRYIDVFGYITIPVMSLTVLLSGIVLALIAMQYPQKESLQEKL